MLLSTHADRQGADISLTVCVFVRLRISPPRIKLAASHFARWFIGVQGRESQIFANVAPPEAEKAKRGRIGQRASHAHQHVTSRPTVEMSRHKRHARDAPFVKPRGDVDVGSASVDIRQSPKTDVRF